MNAEIDRSPGYRPIHAIQRDLLRYCPYSQKCRVLQNELTYAQASIERERRLFAAEDARTADSAYRWTGIPSGDWFQRSAAGFVMVTIEAIAALAMHLLATSATAVLSRPPRAAIQRWRFTAKEGLLGVEEPEMTALPPPPLEPISKTAPEPIDWLWPDVIAAGTLTLLGGPVNQGKSQVLLSAAAIVSRGGTWPCSDARAAPGGVLVLASEDNKANTILPRLRFAGGNLDRIFVTDERHDISTDLDKLIRRASEVPCLRLILFDPMKNFISKQGKSREALEELSRWMNETGVAALGIRHPPKGNDATVASLFSGKADELEFCRSAYFVTPDTREPKRKLMLHAKGNLSGNEAGFSYTIEGTEFENGIKASRVVWEPGRYQRSAMEYLDGSRPPRYRGGAEELYENAGVFAVKTDGPELPWQAEWLRDYLNDRGGSAHGPALKADALAAGIDDKLLYQVAASVDVIQEGPDGRTGKTWRFK